jgi:hypothetical protein
MCISSIVTIPSTILLGSYISLRNTAPAYILLPILQASLVGFTAAIAAHPGVNKTALFGKTSDGEFPWWSYATFYPYLYGLRAYVLMRRMRNKEPVYDEISPGLFVGGWPSAVGDMPPGNPAVVDCTCELPRPAHSNDLPYLNIPTWDSRGPKLEHIDLAVNWAMTKKSQENRPVYIHCAFGKSNLHLVSSYILQLGIPCSNC